MGQIKTILWPYFHSRCINFSNDISNQQFTKSANYRLVFMYKNKEIP